VLANLSHPQPTTSQTNDEKRKKKNNQSSVTTGGNEPSKHTPSKKGVKRKARHEHAVHELDNARQDEEDEKGVDEF